MMRRFLLLMVAVVGNVYATPEDDKAIKETARRTSRAESEVRLSLGGCDRDQSSISTCAEYEFVKADQRLNRLYREQLARVKGTTSERPLVLAQKAWVRFRDLDCDYQASVIVGGSMHGQWVLDCMRDRTVERTTHIESFLNCTANGCPGQ